MGYTMSHEEAIKRTAQIVGFTTPLSSHSKLFHRDFIDIGLFGRGLQAKHPNYDFESRLYEGMDCPLPEFLRLKYGVENTIIIEQALMVNDPNQEKIIRDAAKRVTGMVLGKTQKEINEWVDTKTQSDVWHQLMNELGALLGVSIPIDLDGSLRLNRPQIDVILLDSVLGEKDPEYDWMDCKYLGVTMPMKDYVEIKFGKRASDLVSYFIGLKKLEEVYVEGNENN